MAVETARQVIEEVKLNYFSVRANSNKVWIGRVFSDGYYEAEYGRVGAKTSKRGKAFASVSTARGKLYDKVREQEAEGYRTVSLVDMAFNPSARVLNTPLGAINEQAVRNAKDLLRDLQHGGYDVDVVDAYYRLIPHTFSGQIPFNLLKTSELIEREMRLLDSIGTALSPTTKAQDALVAADAALAELSRMFGV